MSNNIYILIEAIEVYIFNVGATLAPGISMQELEQSTKTESAYRLLRRDILATRLKPSAPMKLGALRDRYEIGWTPLREALSRL